MNRSEDICECGLHWELCCVLAFIDTMCLAAIRGEVRTAQHCAARAIELLTTERLT